MISNERNKTGLSTIDQPWLQQYPNYNELCKLHK